MMRDDESLLEADDVGPQLRALRDELCQAPPLGVAEAHLAAIGDLLAEGSGATVVALGATSRRRRLRAVALPVAATVGALALTCGLAAAGGLPGPAQRQVSRVAGAVGWEIPGRATSHDRPTHPVPARPGAGSGKRDATVPSTSVSGARNGGSSGSSGSPDPAPVVTSIPGSGATRPSGTSPGSSGSAPGHSTGGSTPAAPGASGDAPGHTGATPGRSGSAPGLTDTTPGKSGSAPGHSGATPSATAPGKLEKQADQ